MASLWAFLHRTLLCRKRSPMPDSPLIQSQSQEENQNKEENNNQKIVEEPDVRTKRLQRFQETENLNKKPKQTQEIGKEDVDIGKEENKEKEKLEDKVEQMEVEKSTMKEQVKEIVELIKMVKITSKEENIQDKVHKLLEEIFLFTVTPLDQQPAMRKFTLLKESAFEFDHLSGDVIESCLLERLTMSFPVHAGPFVYLIGCYNRALENLNAKSLLDLTTGENTKLKEILNSVLETIVAFSGLCLSGGIAEKDIQSTRSSFLRLLEADGLGKTLPKGFLAALVTKFDKDGMLVGQFEYILEHIKSTMIPPTFTVSTEAGPVVYSTITMENSMRSLRVIEALAAHTPLAQMIVNLGEFSTVNCSNGRDVELSTLLGPSFGISAFSQEFKEIVMKSHRSNKDPKFRPQDYASLNDTIRVQMQTLQLQLFKTTNALMKISSCREFVLRWFASAQQLNGTRSKYYFPESTHCSHGFAINLSSVLVRLCKPIVDSKTEKMRLVDMRYLLGGFRSRLDYSKIDRMAATNLEIRAIVESEINLPMQNPSNLSEVSPKLQPSISSVLFSSPTLSSLTSSISRQSSQLSYQDSEECITPCNSFTEFTPNFVTELFFLTVNSLHIGLMRAQKSMEQIYRRTDEIFRAYNALLASNPDAPRSDVAFHTKLDSVLNDLRNCFALEQMTLISTSNLEMLRSVAYFYEWSCGFFLRRLSLRNPREQTFLKLMPEHFVENIVEFFELLGRVAIDVIKTDKWHSLLSFVCLCMQRDTGDVTAERTSKGELLITGHLALVKNPHLRAMLADILCLFLPPKQDTGLYRREPDHPFVSHPTLADELVPSLLKLYVDVEYTGRHAQFYEKFNSRQKINELLEFVWDYGKHRETFEKISHSKDDFPKFINTVLSDSIFLLDESIKYLKTIKEIEEKKDNQQLWFQMPKEKRDELEATFESAGGNAKNMMKMGRSTFKILSVCVKNVMHAFLNPLFVDRMACMLDFYIFTLAGPKIKEMRVKDMDKYSFSPKELLRDVLLVFTPLCSSKEFRKCVLQDKRSYQVPVFQSALNLAKNKGVLTVPSDIVAFSNCVAELESENELLNAATNSSASEEIPEEFIDPITGDIMSDPVLLPSKVICDRNTIIRHLMSQPTDPFTQMPMKESQLVDVPDMKLKIEKYKIEKQL